MYKRTNFSNNDELIKDNNVFIPKKDNNFYNSSQPFYNSQINMYSQGQVSKSHNNYNPFNSKSTPLNILQEKKVFYSRVNTSPTKERKYVEDENPDSTNKTIIKCSNSNFYEDMSERENKFLNFLSPNFSSDFNNLPAQTSRFTSNSQVKDKVRILSQEESKEPSEEEEEKENQNLSSKVSGKISSKITSKITSKIISKNSDKPSLNMVESRNKLYDYSKSKNYEEDVKKYSSMPRVTEEETEELEGDCEDEMEIEEVDSKTKRIREIIKNLPVPIEKKDDEAFKILKLKEMRRVSLPSNKSAQVADLEQIPSHRKSFDNGKKKFNLNF